MKKANTKLKVMDRQYSSKMAIGSVKWNEESEEQRDFKTIIRSLLANFKSPNWTSPSINLPFFMTKPNLEFVINEAARHGLSTTVHRVSGSLCISKYSIVNLAFLQLTPLSEQMIQYLIAQVQMRSKYSPMPAYVSQNSKWEGGIGSKLQVNNQWIVPKPNGATHLNSESLPIFQYKSDILKSIKLNTFTLVKGDSGCGKSTQVPQFILEDATTENKRVQIIATVTQRVTAIFLAERIALERGEDIGSSIGYQVRLESKVSPCNTVLTFCTNEILLRSLSQPDYEVLKNTTHIIIDDINERDPYMDFLLTCLKDLLPSFPNLRIVLMGADINLESLNDFLGRRLITVSILKFCYPVETYFLEDIIEMTSSATTLRTNKDTNETSTRSHSDQKEYNFNNEDQKYFDGLLEKVFKFSCRESAAKLINLVISQSIPMNYQHSITEIPILSCFASSGFSPEVKLMLDMGANDIQTNKMNTEKSFVGKYTARDFAAKSKHKGVIDVLTENRNSTVLSVSTACTQNLQSNYLQCLGYSFATHVTNIIYEIHKEEDRSGAILIFLKDYDEIIEVMTKLFHSTKLDKNEFSFYVIHPEVQIVDQKGVFQPSVEGVRKVILSTNIAETSLSFSDIGFVIDSGKDAKKMWSDGDIESSSVPQWISRSSADQRESLAGSNRPGKCFRVYSVTQYDSFSEFTTPEILSSSLLHLCLLCRSLIRLETKIGRFFNLVPSPPDPIRVENTVKLLQIMEALDENETLTDLGNHMIDYPIRPQLAKALFYSVVMKCVDPVLTIVAIRHHGDPFLNSLNETELFQAIEYKRILGSRQRSDHYAFVKLFQEWEKETYSKNGIQFCNKWGLRVSTFEKICTTRTLLLGQLRASGFVKNDIRELNRNSKHWAVVKGVLTAASYPNIARIQRLSETITVGLQDRVYLHPSTTIQGGEIPELKSDWIIFDEMTTSNWHKQIKGCTVVSPTCVALFTGGLGTMANSNIREYTNQKKPHFLNCMALQIGEINIQGMSSSVQLMAQLRILLKCLVSKILRSPLGATSTTDAELVNVIAEVLNHEEHQIGLENVDVSQWPRFVGANMMTLPQIGYKLTNEDSNASACSM